MNSIVSPDPTPIHARDPHESIDWKDLALVRGPAITDDWARLNDHIECRGMDEDLRYLHETRQRSFTDAVVDWLDAARPSLEVVQDLLDVLKKQSATDIEKFHRWTLVNADHWRKSITKLSGAKAWDDSVAKRILY